jgi:hypothetical protein
MQRHKILLTIIAIVMSIAWCRESNAADRADLVRRLLERHAAQLTFDRPLDVCLEAEVEDVQAPSQAVNKLPSSSLSVSSNIRFLRRAGGPAFRMEVKVAGPSVTIRGCTVDGHGWLAPTMTDAPVANAECMQRLAQVLQMATDLCSMWSLAKLPTGDLSLGAAERLLLPNGETVEVQALAVCKEPPKTIALIAAGTEPRLVAARLEVEGSSLTVFFDDFREEKGLRFPMKWVWVSDVSRGTVRVKRITIQRDLPTTVYEQAAKPGTASDNRVAAYETYIKNLAGVAAVPPELKARVEALGKESVRIAKEYKVGSKEWEDALGRLRAQNTALIEELQRYSRSQGIEPAPPKLAVPNCEEIIKTTAGVREIPPDLKPKVEALRLEAEQLTQKYPQGSPEHQEAILKFRQHITELTDELRRRAAAAEKK